MKYFMTEEEALAVIEENMHKIEEKMTSGSSPEYSTNTSSQPGGGNNPCIPDPSFPEPACACCVCA